VFFDHVGVSVSDVEASRGFYDTVLVAIGKERAEVGEKYVEWDDFSIGQASQERPALEHLHVAWWAPDHDAVHAFWQAGVDTGYADDGPPGPRPQYGEDYYGAFLRDPDGNSVEAVHHGAAREPGQVDHLWIGVRDVAASRGFYETLAPWAGLHVGLEEEDRVQFRGERGSFMLVADGRPPTRNLHIAFPAPDHATVEGFHAAMVAAGHVDNGAPGERPEYHPGYYGAFVLDPDGTNVELVDHGR
jgi:catechol 2,3-dioxygenase-like lactoylglutathione lyase family enzyme